MSKSYPAITKRLSANIETLRNYIPDTMASFLALAYASIVWPHPAASNACR